MIKLKLKVRNNAVLLINYAILGFNEFKKTNRHACCYIYT